MNLGKLFNEFIQFWVMKLIKTKFKPFADTTCTKMNYLMLLAGLYLLKSLFPDQRV